MLKPVLTSDIIQGFVESCLIQTFDEPTRTPDFHKELWELCCSKDRLVAIAAPRGHAKSTAITHAFVLASVLFRQADFVVIVSDTETQSKDFLTDIKKVLQTNEEVIKLFNIAGFDKDTETDIVVRFEDGNLFCIRAKGSEQKVRGSKWNDKRPNLIVCDDMENDESVMNKDRREKTRKWFMGALLPSLSPTGKFRVVGTILHQDSLLARLCPVEGLRDTVVEPLKSYTKNKKTAWKSIIFRAHIGKSPTEIHSDADMLWPDRFSKEWFLENYHDKVQLGHPELYSQEFLNRPLDEATAYFRKSDFGVISDTEKSDILEGKKPLLYYVGVDLAISENERADYSVFHVVGIDSNNMMYHQDVLKQRMDGRELIDTLINFKLRYKEKLAFVAIESDKIEKTLKSFLQEEMLKRGVFFDYVPITPSKDKWTRAKPLQGRLRLGGIKFDHEAEYYPDLEAEFLSFPRGVHDDQVDALGIICLALDKILPGLTEKEQQIDDYYANERSSNVRSLDDARRRGRSVFGGY